MNEAINISHRGWRLKLGRASRAVAILCLLAALSAAGQAASIWNNSVTPTDYKSYPDTDPYELGVKFRSDVPGYITGIRFYKGTNNTGTHLGSLWTAGGGKLASVVFAGESAEGWQQQLFTNPVPITAGTTYVASYSCPNGGYAVDIGGFAGATNHPLRALANGEEGGNGVYEMNPGSFPNSGGGNNYWVDVVFSETLGPDTNAPVIVSVTPANGATNVSVGVVVAAVFNEAMLGASVNTNTFQLRNAASNLVPATVSYHAGTQTATLQPSAALGYGQTYTATVRGTTNGVKDLATNALAADYVWSFTTQPPDTTAPTILAVSPPGGAAGVIPTTSVTAVFSEAMLPATIGTNTFTLVTAASNPVPAVVSYDADNFTATLQPAGALGLGQTYTARIRGGGSGVKDGATNALAADYVWSFTITSTSTVSLWSPTNAPDVALDNDSYTLGVKFRSTAAGVIRGIRFYKHAANTGTHLGNLWTADGIKLAETTFVGESASGWQEQLFAAPVAITANTTYIASYFAPNGNYAFTGAYFAGQGVTNAPLVALADGVEGGNGVFIPTPVNDFPNTSFNSANYWVDVIYAPPTVDTNPPVVVTTSPTNGTANASLLAPVTATFNEAMLAATINTNTFELRNAANTLIPANVSYSPGSLTAVLQPHNALVLGQAFTARLKGGSAGVKDAATNALASDFVWSFSTTASLAANIWSDATVPAEPSTTDSDAYELGVKFRSAMPGFIRGIRFYKGTNNTGSHVGNLWTAQGDNLASVTFTNETAQGWQQQMFATPVPIASNTTYVVSYFAPAGGYAVNSGYFAGGGVTNYPLRALAEGEDGPNGVFNAGASGFPVASFNSANYWVDVVFASQDAPPTAGTLNVSLPEDTPTQLVLPGSDAESQVTFQLLTSPARGGLSNFDTNTGALTYTPNTNYYGTDSFTYRVSDGRAFATGSVNLTIISVDDPAVADNQTISLARNTATNLVLTATDVDSTNLVSNVLTATAAVTPNNWTPNTGTNKVTAVASDDGNTSFLTSGSTANTQQQFTLSDPLHIQPGDPINSVSLRSISRRNSTPGGSFRMTAVLGGGTSAGATRTSANNYAEYADTFTSKPGGGAWTIADVQNLQMRIENTQARDIACTRFHAVVNFIGNTNRTYTILSGPDHGTITGLSTNNGTLTYTPAANYTGPDSFTFRVNAGGVLSTGVVSLTVVGTNSGPIVANPIGTQPAGYGTNFNFTFPAGTFTDPDSPVLSYSADGLPPGILFTNASRTFAGIPTASGNYSVNLTATDNSVPPLTATNTFTIAVARAALTITAQSTNKPYGVPFTFAGNEFTAAGLKFTDSVAATALSSAGAPASAGAGAYPIVVTNAAGGAGLTNYLITYVNGTLTVDPPAPYAITFIAVSNGVATITWESISNRSYRLQYKNDLTAPTWTEVPVDIVATGPSTSTTNATGDATNRFYRVK